MNTREAERIIAGLRGDLIDCKCGAKSGADCTCCSDWPENFATDAASLIEVLLATQALARKLLIAVQDEDGHVDPYRGGAVCGVGGDGRLQLKGSVIADLIGLQNTLLDEADAMP